MMIEQNTNYAYKLKYMDNPSFDKVRDLSTKFYRELPQALQDELFEALNRGIVILDSEPQMTTYLYAFGQMHQAKLNYAFKQLPKEFLMQPEINIIDYGCGQALGTMCYADFLHENGYSQKVNAITLIEPSEICLKRAALHASAFFHDTVIKTFNKTIDELDEVDIYYDENFPTLHILSNILDIFDFDLGRFADLIKSQIKGFNLFVCVGPFFGFPGKDNRMKDFCSLISDHDYLFKTFDKYEFDTEKAWTCELCLFSNGNGFYNGKELSSLRLSKDLFELLNNIKELPIEYQFLNNDYEELVERKKCITIIAEKLFANNLLNCEEVSIVDYGCGRGLASICLLGWLRNVNYDLGKIKYVKLVDKDKSVLNQALTLFATFFPSINVITYEQDISNKNFFIECDSILTINLFSHILSDISLYDKLKRLILKSHSLFVHNIVLEEVSSKSYPDRIKSYYFSYVVNNIHDYTGCRIIADDKTIIQKHDSPVDKRKLYRYSILSRTRIEEICIPNHENSFANLCPGEPYKQIENADLMHMWYDQPLRNSKYCELLDDYNMISLEENYISPNHEKIYKKEWDQLNPHTIKECAELFYVGYISHALSCEFPCGDEIVSIYQKAAEEGINEAYNNLGVLFLYDQRDDEATKKGIDYLIKASRGGSQCAMINLASYYMSQGNVDMALTYYNEASKKGNPIALYNLAIATNFGLMNQEIDLVKAEALYRSCLDSISKDPNKQWIDYHLQSRCCLNLILLLNNKGEHYLKILDMFCEAEKPSDDLLYCKEILQITNTNRFSKNTDQILHLTKVEEHEKPYVTFNRAVILYNGLYLKSFKVEIKQDIDKAISILQSLVDKIEDLIWDNKYKYIYPIYASWLNRHRQGSSGQDLVYWEKAAESNPENACAYLTNCATIASDKEKAKKTWQSYAFSYSRGCVSCHECSNYDTTRLTCPKAQYVWATKYEEKNDEKTTLLHQSAEQEYNPSLYYLGFREAIKKHIPELHENNIFNLIPGVPPKEYEPLYPILARDEFFEYLQKASELNHRPARNIMPFVAVFRNDKYNYLYWLCMFNNSVKHEGTKRNLLEFFKSICNKTLEKCFIPKTLCEKQMLSIAEDISKTTDDVQFICTYANYLLESNNLRKAREYYLLAKAKGCSDLDSVLENIDTQIVCEEMEIREIMRNDYYEDHVWRQDTWDAMTDGMYGDMPEGFDGDFDFLGY